MEESWSGFLKGLVLALRPRSGQAHSVLRTVLHDFSGLSYKVPHSGWHETTETYSLTVLEGRSLKSRCQQGCAPLEGSREGSFPASSELSGNSRQLPVFLGLQLHLSASPSIYLCVPVSSPVLVSTPVIGLVHPNTMIMTLRATLFNPVQILGPASSHPSARLCESGFSSSLQDSLLIFPPSYVLKTLVSTSKHPHQFKVQRQLEHGISGKIFQEKWGFISSAIFKLETS